MRAVRRRRSRDLSGASAGPRPRLLLGDQVREAVRVILANPRRQLPAVFAICVGLAAAITVVTVAQAGATAVDREFQRIRATEVSARLGEAASPTAALPKGVDALVGDLPGVTAAGVVIPVGEVRAEVFVGTAPGIEPVNVDVVAVSAGAVDLVVGARQGTDVGWAFDDSDRLVAVAGSTAARRLGLSTSDSQQVFLNGVAFTTIQVTEVSNRRPDLAEAILIPRAAARRLFATTDGESEILIETLPGWAASVGERVPLALFPATPDRVEVTVQPEPARLTDAVTGRTRSLVLAVAAIAMLAGLLAISNSVSASVVERSAELSMRRVFGARPGHLQRHVLTESLIIGLAGGAGGVVVAWNVSMVLVAVRHWHPQVDVAVWLAAPLVGVACGALAGVVPAWRASRIDPAEGIRRG